jgi:acetyl-CoA C-acetyltransferase
LGATAACAALELESQGRAASPGAKTAFDEEMVPVSTGGRRPTTVTTDEQPKPGTTMEALAALRAIRRGK